MLNILKKQELAEGEKGGIEKGKSEENKEAMVSVAIELMNDGFQDEEIARSTKLTLLEIFALIKPFED